jgi:Myosin head (motor domain)
LISSTSAFAIHFIHCTPVIFLICPTLDTENPLLFDAENQPLTRRKLLLPKGSNKVTLRHSNDDADDEDSMQLSFYSHSSGDNESSVPGADVDSVYENHPENIPYAILMGSTTETYLLEKSRVVVHGPNEHTYHIFYQLLAAPQDPKLQIWEEGLANTAYESFKYVGHKDTHASE